MLSKVRVGCIGGGVDFLMPSIKSERDAKFLLSPSPFLFFVFSPFQFFPLAAFNNQEKVLFQILPVE